MVIDPEDLSVRWASAAARRMFGSTPGPLPDLVATGDAASVGTFLQAAAAAGPDSSSSCTCAVPVSDSVPRQVDLVARNLSANQDVAGLVVVASDVTTWAQRSQRLVRRLSTDGKTGLANWTSFLPRLEQAIGGAADSGAAPVLIYLDLDHFKTVNDRFGHAVGDEVLTRTASRIVGVISGLGTAARIGGDEFVILLDRASEAEAVTIAEKILAAVNTPATEVRITASAGITLVHPGLRPDVLLRRADIAMYRAKASGCDRVVVYRDDLADWMLARKHQVEKLAERIEQLHQENQALAEAATTDQRTGLPNPAAFESAHARLNRSGEPYSLLLIDIDHFHGYNTIYRYLAGHETLRKIAQTIRATAGGRTYRYGGEEFTVLLPEVGLTDAVELAERIRLDVERLAIEHKGNLSGIATISVGAVAVGPHTTVTRAIDEASLAVLQAKTAGRNQVVGRQT
jgi:diguanylate cyclase (GGDEF)-like protein